MNPFTTREIDAMRVSITSAMGADTAVGFDALIASIPAGSDITARTTVVTSLACRNLHQLDIAEKERAGMGTIAIAYRCECAVNALVKPRMRLQTNGVDYRIYAVVIRPSNAAPLYYMLYLEDEGVAA